MKLIKELNEYHTQKDGHRRLLGEFLCEFCQAEVVKTLIARYGFLAFGFQDFNSFISKELKKIPTKVI